MENKENEELKKLYEEQENSIEILSETYNQDFDEIAYEPEVIQGDNDEEAANKAARDATKTAKNV